MARGLLNKIKPQIDTAEIISFDIFDTLLFRPYVRSTDMFYHIEKILQLPGFAAARINIERTLRLKRNTTRNVTFDEIYNHLDPPFQSVQPFEINFEKRILRPNPEMRQIYTYAKRQRKKIIIASDMYFPKLVIADILKQNGFNHYDQLYVSADVGFHKRTGTLFQKILSDFKNIPANRVLHIGDNPISDYQSPLKIGLQAVLIPLIVDSFLKRHPYLTFLKKEAESCLESSINLATLAQLWQYRRFNAKPHFEDRLPICLSATDPATLSVPAQSAQCICHAAHYPNNHQSPFLYQNIKQVMEKE